MTFRTRNLSLLIIDAVLVNLAIYSALLLRFDAHIPQNYINAYLGLAPLITIIALLYLYGFKLYARLWEYASINELLAIFSAISFTMITVVTLILTFSLPGLPRSIYLLSWLLMNVYIGVSRISWRIMRTYYLNGKPHQTRRALIVGAGDAGAILAREIRSNTQVNLKVIGFIDDDPSKQRMMLGGIPVLGNRKKIPGIVSSMEVDEIIIAMPSVPGNVVREIMELAQKTPARIRILPGIYQSTNRSIFSHIRDIQMEDLLRREPVRTDLKEISEYISGHTVMVTGAGGSIGSELCRQILDLSPAKLVLVECCENNLFEIENELANRNRPIEIHPELIDVRHIAALEKVFLKHHPQVVFHAAAYKHVPMMERHPEEAFYNNVLGTRNMAVLSDRYGVETFIFISTDKAVNPTSVMGASKRLAEMIIRDVNHHSKTNFAAVRFGNVLGSRGSVIPTFIKQIEQGGPVTVTHPEMKRYFMTIPEAVQLVIQAGAMAKGGEIFVLDMGKPVKIVDLAKDLIRLAGYEPGVDIEIKYTGIRPGEKLYEELFTNKEQMVSTKHERIFISNDELEEKYNNIEKTILTFAQVGRTNNKDVVEMIKKLVPEYRGTAGEQERDEMVVG
ncbi:MAG: polysaccharide biosynthesis protein [Syntrophomonadaceae bacterium]